MLVGALLLVVAASAPASAQYSDLVVTPDVVRIGGTVSVTGQGFAPSDEVTLYLLAGDQTGGNNGPKAVPVPAGGVGVGIAPTDGSGNFTTTFVVPAGTALGETTVVAEDETLVRSVTITIVADETPPTTPGTTPGGVIGDGDGQGFGNGNGSGNGSGSGNLARTGSNLNGLGLIGAGLLAAGGLVLLATRRRQADQPRSTATAA